MKKIHRKPRKGLPPRELNWQFANAGTGGGAHRAQERRDAKFAADLEARRAYAKAHAQESR